MDAILTFFLHGCVFDKSSKRARSVCLLFSFYKFCQVRAFFLHTSAIVFVSMKNEVSD